MKMALVLLTSLVAFQSVKARDRGSAVPQFGHQVPAGDEPLAEADRATGARPNAKSTAAGTGKQRSFYGL